MGDRAVYCARLESVCAERHPGFESPPIRQRRNAFRSPSRVVLNPAMRAFLALFFGALFSAQAANQEKIYLVNLIEAARSDYKTGQLDSALTKLDLHEKAKGPTAESLDLRGAIALEQGKFDLARKSFAEAQALAPGLFAPRLHLGDLALREKKYAEAGGIYEQLLTETNILISNERLRYALLIVALASHDEAAATRTLANIKFPTQSPAYYYAQTAWEFAHGNNRSAEKWIATAREIFEPQSLAWFARPLYDLGWIKQKPPASL